MAIRNGADEKAFVQTCLALSQDIMKLPAEHIWFDYDREADVLYVSFRRLQRAKKQLRPMMIY